MIFFGFEGEEGAEAVRLATVKVDGIKKYATPRRKTAATASCAKRFVKDRAETRGMAERRERV